MNIILEFIIFVTFLACLIYLIIKKCKCCHFQKRSVLHKFYLFIYLFIYFLMETLRFFQIKTLQKFYLDEGI